MKKMVTVTATTALALSGTALATPSAQAAAYGTASVSFGDFTFPGTSGCWQHHGVWQVDPPAGTDSWTIDLDVTGPSGAWEGSIFDYGSDDSYRAGFDDYVFLCNYVSDRGLYTVSGTVEFTDWDVSYGTTSTIRVSDTFRVRDRVSAPAAAPTAPKVIKKVSPGAKKGTATVRVMRGGRPVSGNRVIWERKSPRGWAAVKTTRTNGAGKSTIRRAAKGTYRAWVAGWSARTGSFRIR